MFESVIPTGSIIPLGHISVNSLSKLKCIGSLTQKVSSMHPSLADIDLSDGEDDYGQPLPHFDSRSKLFELESCGPYGTVVLVYDSQTTKTGGL